jgi:hypothetical protein
MQVRRLIPQAREVDLVRCEDLPERLFHDRNDLHYVRSRSLVEIREFGYVSIPNDAAEARELGICDLKHAAAFVGPEDDLACRIAEDTVWLTHSHLRDSRRGASGRRGMMTQSL